MLLLINNPKDCWRLISNNFELIYFIHYNKYIGVYKFSSTHLQK